MKMSTLDVQRTSNKINLVEASIEELLHTLNVRAISSVQLVSLYLHRIGYYDCRGPSLNSVCVLNPNAFHEAQESDDYRASGLPPRPLEGIPFTVKDSFKVKGMTVAAGSPAFSDLVASDDAAIVSLLREAGARPICRQWLMVGDNEDFMAGQKAPTTPHIQLRPMHLALQMGLAHQQLQASPPLDLLAKLFLREGRRHRIMRLLDTRRLGG
jgi:hypothetical protein